MTQKTNGPMARAESVLPSNLSAERCVLGALIEDDSLLPPVLATGVKSNHFLLADHRRMLQAIELLHARNAPVDYVSVTEQLGNRNEDYAIIADLLHGLVLYEDHILHHARIVRRKANLRGLLKIGEWIAEAVTESADPDLLIAQIRNRLDACLESHISA
jgi:replicative DNA helicase